MAVQWGLTTCPKLRILFLNYEQAEACRTCIEKVFKRCWRWLAFDVHRSHCKCHCFLRLTRSPLFLLMSLKGLYKWTTCVADSSLRNEIFILFYFMIHTKPWWCCYLLGMQSSCTPLKIKAFLLSWIYNTIWCSQTYIKYFMAHLSLSQVLENGISYLVSLEGQKTGFYADQRENRQFIRSISEGQRVLDMCCYTGGFALNAASGNAMSVTGISHHCIAIFLFSSCQFL